MQRRKTIFVVGSLVVIGLLVAIALYFDSGVRRITDTIHTQLTDVARTTFVPHRTPTTDAEVSSNMRAQAIQEAYGVCYSRTNVDLDACSRYVNSFFLQNDFDVKHLLICIDQNPEWRKVEAQPALLDCLYNAGVPLPPGTK